MNQQQQLQQPQVKLAPWAKASEENVSRDLSLCEIQVKSVQTWFGVQHSVIHYILHDRNLKKVVPEKNVSEGN